MHKKKLYIKPVAENVIMPDPLMDLELKVSGAYVDDEAAKPNSGFLFDEEESTPVKQNINVWDD